MMLNDLPPLPAWSIPKQHKIKQQEPVDRRDIFVGVFRAILDKRLTSGEFRVLMAICSFANKAGMAWPGQDRISQMVDITRPNVTRAVQKLIELNYLRVVSRGNSMAARATCYQVLRREDAPGALDAIAIAADRTVEEDLTPPHLKPKETRMEDKPVSQEEGKKRSREVLSKLRKRPAGKAVDNSPQPVDKQVSDVPPAAHMEAERCAVGSTSNVLLGAHQQPSELVSNTNNYLLVFTQLNAKIARRQVVLNENDQAAARELTTLGVDPYEFAALVEADLDWRMGGGKPMPAGLAFYLPTFRKLMAP
jgi:hypothetical protein